MLFFVSMQVHAEACSYDEAVLALQRGNTVRAQALLKMAASDGDKRAQRLVATLQLVTTLATPATLTTTATHTTPATHTTKEKLSFYLAVQSLAKSSAHPFPDSSSQ